MLVYEYAQDVECAVCGTSLAVLGTHLKRCHGMTGEEYREEFGAGREIASESYRAAHFSGRPIAGIAHWEGLWCHHYVTDSRHSELLADTGLDRSRLPQFLLRQHAASRFHQATVARPPSCRRASVRAAISLRRGRMQKQQEPK